MRNNRLWIAVGVGLMGLVGFSADASAAGPSCLLPTQCPADKPICSFGECKPCDNALEGLSCLLTANPGFTCSTEGATKGQCVSASNTTAPTLPGLPGSSSSSSSSGSTPQVPLTGTCSQDADCGDEKSGLICDVLQKSCLAGCRINGNGCSLGLSCNILEQEVGLCLIPAKDCAKDSDCGGGLSGTVCGTDNKCQPGCRAQALGNQCAVGLECHLDSEHTIGACILPTTPSPNTNCKVDADCGAKYSGLICDTKSGSCITGCRAHDEGNECPADMLCNPTFDLFGLCIIKDGKPIGSSSGSSGTTVPSNPTSRKPIVADGPSANTQTSASASEDLEVEGGGCNVTSGESGTTSAAIFGLALGAAAIVSRRNKKSGSVK